MTVIVWVTQKGTQRKEVEVFKSEIKSKKEYNSWFYVDFENKVFVPKGATFWVEVRSANVYQLIPQTHIKENIAKAEKCAAFSEFEFNFFERIHRKDKEYTVKSWEIDGDCLFCIKSLSVVPVDEQGFLNLNM